MHLKQCLGKIQKILHLYQKEQRSQINNLSYYIRWKRGKINPKKTEGRQDNEDNDETRDHFKVNLENNGINQ